MKNLLALLAAAALTFAGLGWYLGWYQIRRESAPSGHQSLSIDINGSKIRTDVEKGIKKIEDKRNQKESHLLQDASQQMEQ